jgi:hypothetical protein
VIAYVFWHQARSETTRAAYEQALIAFYQPLLRAHPAGLQGVWVNRTSRLPWLPAQDHAFEEWYLLEDSTALDVLNDAAVSGDRLQPHNRAAAMAAAGTAGVYSLRLGEQSATPPRKAQWFSKPDDMTYQNFFDSLTPLIMPGVTLWGRRMVLGPTPEFCLQGPHITPLPYLAQSCDLSTLFYQSIA